MTDQLSLLGIPDAQPPTDRLFFGLFPDAAAVRGIEDTQRQLAARHGLTGKPLRPERFHITLFLLGDYVGVPPGVVRAARTAATGLAAPPFRVEFDRAGSFSGKPGKLPFVLLGSDGLGALQIFRQNLGRALARAGLPGAGGAPFTPHVTLLYDARSVPVAGVNPIEWTVHDFVLIHSELGRTRYHELGRWPLR